MSFLEGDYVIKGSLGWYTGGPWWEYFGISYYLKFKVEPLENTMHSASTHQIINFDFTKTGLQWTPDR